MINTKFMLWSILLILLFSIQTVFAVNKTIAKQQLPTTYPYSYPFDEHPCPTGNCSRKNENKSWNRDKNRKKRDKDDD